MIHDVDWDNENATTSTLHNLPGPLCALSTQSVVPIIYLSDLKGRDKEASSLGSPADSVSEQSDCPDVEFVIPLKLPTHVSPPKAKKKKSSYESTYKFQVSWVPKLLWV